MTRIYLIRHAQAEGNLYRRLHGVYNSTVTELGKRQIAALTARFDKIHIDAVYSSPLFRCTTTAKAIYQHKNLPLNIDNGLIEMGVGIWEDKPFGYVQQFDADNMRLFLSASSMFKIPQAETYAEVQKRIVNTLLNIAKNNEGKTVACFTHGMVTRTALAYFHGYGFDLYKVKQSDNTGVSCLEIENGQVKVLFEADNTHLPLEISSAIKKSKSESLTFAAGDRNLWYRPWKPYLERDLYISYRHEAWIDIHGREEPFDGESFYNVALKSSEEDENAVMLAYLGRDLVGLIQMDLERDAGIGVCFVPFVYMNPEYRHKGLGVQLIGQAVSTARRLGRDKLRLRCAPTNFVAKRFYKRYGFKKIGMADDSRLPLELLEKFIGYLD